MGSLCAETAEALSKASLVRELQGLRDHRRGCGRGWGFCGSGLSGLPHPSLGWVWPGPRTPHPLPAAPSWQPLLVDPAPAVVHTRVTTRAVGRVAGQFLAVCGVWRGGKGGHSVPGFLVGEDPQDPLPRELGGAMLALGCWALRGSDREWSQRPGRRALCSLSSCPPGPGHLGKPIFQNAGKDIPTEWEMEPLGTHPWPQAGTAPHVGVAGLAGPAPGAAPPSSSRGAHAHGLGARRLRLLGPRGGQHSARPLSPVHRL